LPHNTVSPADFLDLAKPRNTVFSSMAFIFDERDNLTGNGQPQEVVVQDVSASFFFPARVDPSSALASLSKMASPVTPTS